MSDHDPLCQKGHSRTSRCWGFIDEIRADERERIAQDIMALRVPIRDRAADKRDYDEGLRDAYDAARGGESE